jgi:hypothetical protein
MNKHKRLFLLLAIVFFLMLSYASYDIASRTTFPGSKGQLKERIDKTYLETDSISTDSMELTKKKIKN